MSTPSGSSADNEANDSENELSAGIMPLVDHLVELRNRLMIAVVVFFVAFGLMYLVKEQIYGFLVQPLADLLGEGEGRRLIYTGLTEAFFTYLKVAFFAAAFLSTPVVLGQIWLFVAPGLYKNEKRALFPFLFATPVLFVAGAATVYYLVFPLAWQFFLSFETPGGDGQLPVMLEARVGEYLDLVMKLIFAFGLCFQLPVLLLLLSRIGVATAESLVKWRKYVIVAIFSVAALLTPPDIISQVLLGIPLIALYEISLVLVRMTEKKRSGMADEAGQQDNAGL